MPIKTYSPYLFVFIALSLFGLWSNKNVQYSRAPERSIASDCNSIISELISPKKQQDRFKKNTGNLQTERLFKFKNNIWNKVMGPHDFENFKDQEYFRWMEIYKDGNAELSSFNPVSIEQKMALIEVINQRLIHTPFYAQKNLTEEAQKLNLYKLRKLQSHMKNFDMTSNMTREDLHNFAADLMIILKGPPISLMDYFTNNKTAKMNARLIRMVQEDILLMGLKGMLDRIPEKNSYTSLERGRYIVKRFFQHKMWKYMALPYDLPWFEKVKIPDELLENIMTNGLEAHDQELIAHLKKQNMIDHYERFRKAYKPIAFSIGFYFYYEKYNNAFKTKAAETQEEENAKFIEFFENLSDKVLDFNAPVEKSEVLLKEEQLKRMIDSYRKRYKEDPSAEIIKEMRAKIYRKN